MNTLLFADIHFFWRQHFDARSSVFQLFFHIFLLNLWPLCLSSAFCLWIQIHRDYESIPKDLSVYHIVMQHSRSIHGKKKLNIAELHFAYHSHHLHKNLEIIETQQVWNPMKLLMWTFRSQIALQYLWMYLPIYSSQFLYCLVYSVYV